ncbi:unnamed protein product [Spirodela intermedia]|uniref:Uncharacterized protein n=1 Tax=Spirodela intermedia TaxID=51605 RepID=A0A7I8IHL6_SPIIN|nr:unnamed protein product [Spirodela intermedia]CAA6656342.1 unnamed protein product [Spirodela intermedia]
MYSRCGSFESAWCLFEKMPTRTLHTWSSILSACVDHGFFEEALSLLLGLLEEEMELQFFVFPAILRACGGLSELRLGKQLHGFVVKLGFISSIYLGNSLIDMYGKCESPKMLNRMRASGDPSPNLVSWSAVLGGFAQNGYDREALGMFYQMKAAGVEPNARVLASILPACGRLQSLTIGKEIHGYVVRHQYSSNPYIINGLVDFYRRCGDMVSAFRIFSRFSSRNSASFNTMLVGFCENGEVETARRLFDEMELLGVKRDSISWNSMISGYADNRRSGKAMELFRDMQFEEGVAADSFTLGSSIMACAEAASLGRGKEIHSFALTRGLSSYTHVSGALVEMYCRCGDLESARRIFERARSKDLAIWNSLISGYARSNQMEQARFLLGMMKQGGLEPNGHTWNGILSGQMENEQYESVLHVLGSIERGKQIHAHLIRSCWDSGTHLGTGLVDMYAKCGSIKLAEAAFQRISHHNLVACNTMLAGFAAHGLGKKVGALFRRLLSDGVDPDEITFLSVLSSCAHEGAIDRSYEYFALMEKFGLKPGVKHYSCMVDLLSRAGHLGEAFKLAREMPVEPDAVMWGAILRGCVLHGFPELGEVAAKKLIQLERNAGNYVVLAKLYASARRRDESAEMMRLLRGKKMKRSSGCSWIEDGRKVRVFLAGDTSHEETAEIYETLIRLNSHMKSE